MNIPTHCLSISIKTLLFTSSQMELVVRQNMGWMDNCNRYRPANGTWIQPWLWSIWRHLFISIKSVYISCIVYFHQYIYTDYFDITITKKIIGLSDNEAYFNKLNELIINPKYTKYLYKMTEYGAYKLVSTIIQPNYNFYHKNVIKMTIVHMKP